MCIRDRGCRKSNRTGIDTLSIFGMQMRYFSDSFVKIFCSHQFSQFFRKNIFFLVLWYLSLDLFYKILQNFSFIPWYKHTGFLKSLSMIHFEKFNFLFFSAKNLSWIFIHLQNHTLEIYILSKIMYIWNKETILLLVNIYNLIY